MDVLSKSVFRIVLVDISRKPELLWWHALVRALLHVLPKKTFHFRSFPSVWLASMIERWLRVDCSIMNKDSTISGSMVLLLTNLFPKIAQAISEVWVLGRKSRNDAPLGSNPHLSDSLLQSELLQCRPSAGFPKSVRKQWASIRRMT
jgi:hypothetical protein